MDAINSAYAIVDLGIGFLVGFSFYSFREILRGRATLNGKIKLYVPMSRYTVWPTHGELCKWHSLNPVVDKEVPHIRGLV